MKIAVTGASGFVGQQLVPFLKARGAETLLVGRDVERLRQAFTDEKVCTYSELREEAAGFDVLLHLAVVNNDANVPDEVFFDVNVRQMLDVVSVARQAGIGHFVLVSSTHALDDGNVGQYAASKRAAAQHLAEVNGIATSIVYLPSVYADEWSGQLQKLNRLPTPLARLLFRFLAAIKPTVHVSRLADFVLSNSQARIEDEVILSDGQGSNLIYRSVRRLIDLGFALTMLVCFWWLLIAIWAAIRLQSPGPGLFAQKRVGRHGKVFICYKFRTMSLGTVERGTHEVSSNAVTKIGGFLRRTKLDELPQIFNILKNEISLVGPRPCLPVQTELIEARRRRDVLKLKPGITGLSQVNGIDMSEPETLARWDSRYAALQSLMLDLRIILSTAIGRGQGDRVL